MKELDQIKARLAAATKPLACKCGSENLRLPEYDYAFPYRGEDFYYCEKCGERVDAPEPVSSPDISRLIQAVEVLFAACESLKGYESMNDYPAHEVRHTLCVAVPHEAGEAQAKALAILRGDL